MSREQLALLYIYFFELYTEVQFWCMCAVITLVLE